MRQSSLRGHPSPIPLPQAESALPQPPPQVLVLSPGHPFIYFCPTRQGVQSGSLVSHLNLQVEEVLQDYCDFFFLFLQQSSPSANHILPLHTGLCFRLEQLSHSLLLLCSIQHRRALPLFLSARGALNFGLWPSHCCKKLMGLSLPPCHLSSCFTCHCAFFS